MKMKTTAKTYKSPDVKASTSDFISRIAVIPVATFTRMVMKSGLPSAESGALIASFKRLRE